MELLLAPARANRLLAGKAGDLQRAQLDLSEVHHEPAVGETRPDDLPESAREELLSYGVQLGVHIKAYVDIQFQKGVAWTWKIDVSQADSGWRVERAFKVDGLSVHELPVQDSVDSVELVRSLPAFVSELLEIVPPTPSSQSEEGRQAP